MFTIGQNYVLGNRCFTITKNLLTEPHHSHEVYLALDEAQQAWVIKFATTALAVEQLQHEQAILQELNHVIGTPQTRALVKFQDKTQPHVLAAHITEYIPHHYTLAHYLRFHPTLAQQTKMIPDIFTWFQQCIDVVATVHEQGIAHGDLKLQNCVLDDRGQIHIIDWDHGHWLKQAERPKTIEGTPPYMSPEHLRGQAPDPLTDMYTLGMMFMAVTYGSLMTPLYAWVRPKPQRREKAAVVRAIVAGETAKYQLYPLPRTPLEMNLQTIWQRMTQPERADRFPNMRSIKQLMNDFIK